MYCPHCEEPLSDPTALTCPSCHQPLDRELTSANYFAASDFQAASDLQLVTPVLVHATEEQGAEAVEAELAVVPATRQSRPLPKLDPLPVDPETQTVLDLQPDELAAVAQGAPRSAPKLRVTLMAGAALAVLLIIVATLALAVGTRPAATVAKVAPTFTAVPTAPAPGTVLYQSAFTAPVRNWPANPATCLFAADGYHIRSGTICPAPLAASDNVDATATVQTPTGGTMVGLVVRHMANGDTYFFAIDGTGHWLFARVLAGQASYVVAPTLNTAVKTIAGSTNTLRLVAVGSQFTFVVNGTTVGQTTDATITKGVLGLAAIAGDGIFTKLVVAQPSIPA